LENTILWETSRYKNTSFRNNKYTRWDDVGIIPRLARLVYIYVYILENNIIYKFMTVRSVRVFIPSKRHGQDIFDVPYVCYVIIYHVVISSYLEETYKYITQYVYCYNQRGKYSIHVSKVWCRCTTGLYILYCIIYILEIFNNDQWEYNLQFYAFELSSYQEENHFVLGLQIRLR